MYPYVFGHRLIPLAEGSLSTFLKTTRVRVLNENDCNNQYREATYNSNLRATGLLCALGQNDSTACRGDSGGPLACFDPVTREPLLAGIISFQHGKACSTEFPLFTMAISNQLAFIEHHMRNSDDHDF